MEFTSRTMNLGDLRIRWVEQGEGRPIVFLHGFPTAPALWRKVMPRVEGARMLCVELVGYGESIPEGAGRDLSLRAQAEYVVRWMEGIGLERALFVGHHLGGGIAQILAVRHPPRVEGMLLVNSVCYEDWPSSRVGAIAHSAGLIDRMPDGAVREILRKLFRRGHDSPEQAREAIELYWPYYEASPDGAGDALVAQARALDPQDTLQIADALADLDLPARLVWGAADRFLSFASAKRLARDLAAPLDLIPEARHFVPEDHPDRVVSGIHQLLDEIHWRATLPRAGVSVGTQPTPGGRP